MRRALGGTVEVPSCDGRGPFGLSRQIWTFVGSGGLLSKAAQRTTVPLYHDYLLHPLVTRCGEFVPLPPQRLDVVFAA